MRPIQRAASVLGLSFCTVGACTCPETTPLMMLLIDPQPMFDPPPKFFVCDEITELPSFIRSSDIEAILGTAYVVFDGDEGVLEDICKKIKMAIDREIEHSTGEEWSPEFMSSWARYKAGWWGLWELERQSATRDSEVEFRAADALACGDYLPDGVVVCADDPLPPPEGEVVFVAGSTESMIPLDDPTRHHQYAVVFDSDGDPSNNYQAAPQFPQDFFQGTDLWYVATYTPADGWSLEVSRATGGTIQSVESNARFVIHENAIMAFIPRSEFATSCPTYRTTAFTHLGDWGLDPPHVWNGDLEPTLEAPLYDVCE